MFQNTNTHILISTWRCWAKFAVLNSLLRNKWKEWLFFTTQTFFQWKYFSYNKTYSSIDVHLHMCLLLLSFSVVFTHKGFFSNIMQIKLNYSNMMGADIWEKKNYLTEDIHKPNLLFSERKRNPETQSKISMGSFIFCLKQHALIMLVIGEFI